MTVDVIRVTERLTFLLVLYFFPCRYLLLISIGGICLIIVLFKVTYRSRTSLTGLARRTVLRCLVGNQQAVQVGSHEVSAAEFDEVVGDMNL